MRREFVSLNYTQSSAMNKNETESTEIELQVQLKSPDSVFMLAFNHR